MKALILFAALLVSVSARAESLVTEIRETLYNVQIDGQKTPYTGVLTMDFVENKIRVDLFEDVCGELLPPDPNVIRCAAAATLVQTLEVPLQERLISCGSYIYQGTLDQTIVDGPRTTIRVADHGRRVCKDLLPSRFMVKATLFAPRVNQTTTYLLFK